LLGLFQRRLFFTLKLDQLFPGSPQTDLVFFQLCLKCGSGEVPMVEPRLGLVHQCLQNRDLFAPGGSVIARCGRELLSTEKGGK